MTHIEPQISQKTNTSKYVETFLVWQAFAKLAKLAVNTPRPAGISVISEICGSPSSSSRLLTPSAVSSHPTCRTISHAKRIHSLTSDKHYAI